MLSRIDAGKWLCLFFYPLNFTFVCPTEITAFSDAKATFDKLNCAVVGVSIDSEHSHLAWLNSPRVDGTFCVSRKFRVATCRPANVSKKHAVRAIGFQIVAIA